MSTKKLQQIISYYGEQEQKTKAIEELCELATELTRDLIDNGNRQNIIEEVADCYNMLDQLVIIYGIMNTVQHVRKQKIQRTLERIDSEGHIDRIPMQYEWGVKK
jgi:NTP pyrophosphatase (non-canonical NTP hydrolase)